MKDCLAGARLKEKMTCDVEGHCPVKSREVWEWHVTVCLTCKEEESNG